MLRQFRRQDPRRNLKNQTRIRFFGRRKFKKKQGSCRPSEMAYLPTSGLFYRQITCQNRVFTSGRRKLTRVDFGIFGCRILKSQSIVAFLAVGFGVHGCGFPLTFACRINFLTFIKNPLRILIKVQTLTWPLPLCTCIQNKVNE